MDKVFERLYIGDGADGRNAEALRAAGITSVMNAQVESDQLGGQFGYLRLDQPDGAPIPSYVLDRFFIWMRREMAMPRAKVLIHCGAGVSRASTFVIAWLMAAGLSWDEGEAVVRCCRPVIAPHPELKKSVLAYFGCPQ